MHPDRRSPTFAWALAAMLGLMVCGAGVQLLPSGCASAAAPKAGRELTKRWLFVWREMTDPAEVDRTIALFPRAEKAGYNAVVLTYEIAPGKVEELKAAARQHHLALIPIVMGGPHDPE
jgi:hypothetical protein